MEPTREIYKGPHQIYMGIHKIYKGVNVIKNNIHAILSKSIRGSIALLKEIQKGIHEI